RALADMALLAKDFDGARKYFDRLVELDPQNLRLRLEYAEALDRNGQPKARVLEELERADKIVEKSANPLVRAEVLMRVGEAAEAATEGDRAGAAYRKGLSLLPHDHYLRRELYDKLVGLARHSDELRPLAQELEKGGAKGFVEWEVLARVYDELGE